MRILEEMGYELYASLGTADFYLAHGIKMSPVEWPFESNGSNGKVPIDDDFKSIADYVEQKQFDLIINIPLRGRGAFRVSSFITNGYK